MHDEPRPATRSTPSRRPSASTQIPSDAGSRLGARRRVRGPGATDRSVRPGARASGGLGRRLERRPSPRLRSAGTSQHPPSSPFGPTTAARRGSGVGLDRRRRRPVGRAGVGRHRARPWRRRRSRSTGRRPGRGPGHQRRRAAAGHDRRVVGDHQRGRQGQPGRRPDHGRGLVRRRQSRGHPGDRRGIGRHL